MFGTHALARGIEVERECAFEVYRSWSLAMMANICWGESLLSVFRLWFSLSARGVGSCTLQTDLAHEVPW